MESVKSAHYILKFRTETRHFMQVSIQLPANLSFKKGVVKCSKLLGNWEKLISVRKEIVILLNVGFGDQRYGVMPCR